MKPRNEALHADIDRLVDLKMQMQTPKKIAAKHGSTAQSVRVLISREVKRRKLTNVNIHDSKQDAKIAHRSEDSCENSRSLP